MISEVLVIEDTAIDAELLRRTFRKSAEYKHVQLSVVETLAEAFEIMDPDRYELIVTDLHVPDAHGADIVEQLQYRYPQIPIIVQTAIHDQTVAQEAISAGAQDFLIKGEFDSKTLERAIRYAIRRHQTILVNQNLTRKLSRQRKALIEKNLKLKRAVEMANEFVDNVSHEFRTPLTVILDYASILKEGFLGELNADQARMIDTISDRSEDLNNMVNDMLDSSRIKAGILAFHRDKCDMESIVERIQTGLELKASLRKTDLKFELPDNLPDVYCDAEKAGRVITNLVTNAIKFCGDNGQVRVWFEHRDFHRDVVVHVRDNGPGMSEEEQKIIYNRFTQLAQTRENHKQGFGLGLSIVKQLVDLNLGELFLASKLGHGTTFSFSVPVCHCEEIVTRHLKCLPQSPSYRLGLYHAKAPAGSDPEAARELNAFWKYLQQRQDFVFQFGPGEWVLLFKQSKPGAVPFLEMVQQATEELNRKRPLEPLPKLEIESRGQYSGVLNPGEILDQIRKVTGVDQPASTRPPHFATQQPLNQAVQDENCLLNQPVLEAIQ